MCIRDRSYTYNNQLTGASKTTTTLNVNSTGITLDHSGQNITISDLGIIMTSTSIKALSAGLYPLLLADSSGTTVAYVTDTGALACQGISSTKVALVDSLHLFSTNASIDSSGDIIGSSLATNGSSGISVYNGSTKTHQ